MINYQIIIEYLGSNYVGWQYQKNGVSIQSLAVNGGIIPPMSDHSVIESPESVNLVIPPIETIKNINIRLKLIQ